MRTSIVMPLMVALSLSVALKTAMAQTATEPFRPGDPAVDDAARDKQSGSLVSVKDCGAEGDGIADDTKAFQSAVTALQAAGGGALLIPTGTYLLKGSASSDGYKNGVVIPFTAQHGGKSVHIVGDSRGGSRLICGSPDMIAIRLSDSYCSIRNIQIEGKSLSNVIGIALAPEIIDGNKGKVAQQFNSISDVYINYCTEAALMLTCGNGGTHSSGCYYNEFRNVSILGGKRGVWLRSGGKTPPTSNVNRNQFYSVRVTDVNTAFHIESGDTNVFVGCSAEGVTRRDGPSDVPTAVSISNLDANGHANQENRLFGFTAESCIRDVYNANAHTEFHGCLFNGKKCLFEAIPLVIQGGYDGSYLPQVFPFGIYQANYLVKGYELGLNVNCEVFDTGGRFKDWDLSGKGTTGNITSYPINYRSSVSAKWQQLGRIATVFLRMKFQVTNAAEAVTLKLPRGAEAATHVTYGNVKPTRIPVYVVGVSGESLVFGYFSATDTLTIPAPSGGWHAGPDSEIHLTVQYRAS